MIVLIKSGPTLGPRKVIPDSPIKLLGFSFNHFNQSEGVILDSCHFKFLFPLLVFAVNNRVDFMFKFVLIFCNTPIVYNCVLCLHHQYV